MMTATRTKADMEIMELNSGRYISETMDYLSLQVLKAHSMYKKI